MIERCSINTSLATTSRIAPNLTGSARSSTSTISVVISDVGSAAGASLSTWDGVDSAAVALGATNAPDTMIADEPTTATGLTWGCLNVRALTSTAQTASHIDSPLFGRWFMGSAN